MSTTSTTAFVSAKLYSVIFECSERTAYRRLKEARAFLKKGRKQRLTIKEVALVEGIELNYIIEICREKAGR